MRSSRHLVALGVLALLLMVALSGCFRSDWAITLNGDGSGSYTLNIGFSEQLVSLASDQISQQMNSYGEKIKQSGGSSRHYDDTGYSYWAYTRPFSSVAQLNQMLRETPAPSQSGSTSGISVTMGNTADGAFQVAQTSGGLTNAFHVTGRMSLAAISIPTNPSTPLPVNVTSLLQDMRETFAVTMPGWVSSHVGGTQSGNTVTYTVHYGESATIDVVGGGYNTGILYPAGAGLGLVGLGGLAAGVVVWQLRRRKAARSETATVSPRD
jgi:hypothetical protein